MIFSLDKLLGTILWGRLGDLARQHKPGKHGPRNRRFAILLSRPNKNQLLWAFLHHFGGGREKPLKWEKGVVDSLRRGSETNLYGQKGRKDNIFKKKGN